MSLPQLVRTSAFFRPNSGRSPRLLEIVFDDRAENIHKNQEKSSFLAIFSRFFEFQPSLPRNFRGNCRSVASISDRDSLPAWIKAEQESAGRRDHRHAETSSRVCLGTASRLAEIIERTMHVKSSIADAEQNCWTL